MPVFPATGRDPSDAELYLAHQQGAAADGEADERPREAVVGAPGGHSEEGPGNGEDQDDGEEGLDLERHGAHLPQATPMTHRPKGVRRRQRRRTGNSGAYSAFSSSVISETDPFASPKSIDVFGFTNSGLSMPA